MDIIFYTNFPQLFPLYNMYLYEVAVKYLSVATVGAFVYSIVCMFNCIFKNNIVLLGINPISWVRLQTYSPYAHTSIPRTSTCRPYTFLLRAGIEPTTRRAVNSINVNIQLINLLNYLTM